MTDSNNSERTSLKREDKCIRSERLMTLKDQLRIYLRHRDMTAAQLARKTGVRKGLISDYLAGVPPRKLEAVKSICDALGVSVDHLCFGTGIQKDETSEGLLSALVDGDGWISGQFEIKLRRIKK
jgi:transcriptional regulator with XRE-family HTH domain